MGGMEKHLPSWEGVRRTLVDGMPWSSARGEGRRRGICWGGGLLLVQCERETTSFLAADDS